jgi:hypothetical protein
VAVIASGYGVGFAVGPKPRTPAFWHYYPLAGALVVLAAAVLLVGIPLLNGQAR